MERFSFGFLATARFSCMVLQCCNCGLETFENVVIRSLILFIKRKLSEVTQKSNLFALLSKLHQILSYFEIISPICILVNLQSLKISSCSKRIVTFVKYSQV